MFKLNLKIAIRNLFKNKVYGAINIGGLALGLTAFVLLLLYVNNELKYDKWDPSLKTVYQLREQHDLFTPDNKQHWTQSVESRVGALVSNKVPQFEHVTKLGISWGEGYSLKVDNADPVLIENVRDADSSFFKVFPYHFIQGDETTAINRPNTIVLKKSLAMKLFGKVDVLGRKIKVLMWQTDEGTTVTVTGVVDDPSTPESANFNAILHTGDREKDPEEIGSSNYCEIYASASRQLDTADVNKVLQKIYVDYQKGSFSQMKLSFDDYYKNGKTPGLKVIPLHEVHANPPFSKGWLNNLKPIIALSVFLLLVSIINFVNLATAQSVQRAKEVGVKKVLGAYRRQLVVQFLCEAAVQSLSALFLCVILVEVLLPAFNNHFDIQLSFWQSEHLMMLVIQLLAVFAVVTLLAGLYPALILSKYNPVKVLKGNYESGFGGLALRNGLIVVQFIIAICFITGIGVMYQQTNYVANKDLGFDRQSLVNISTSYNQADLFPERIRRIPGVKYVATTTQIMGNTFNVPEEITYKNEKFSVNTVTVTMDALPALGVQLIGGRLFSPEYKQDTVNSVVMNQSAASLLGKDVVGKVYDVKTEHEKYTFKVVGIIKDYHNEGFDKAVLPTVYKVTHLGGNSSTDNLLIRFDTKNFQPIMKEIELEWKKLFPDFPMQYRTAEDAFQNELKPARRLMQIVILFSLISVFLSLLGLFALSTFMAKRRTKEIAIRKILGASNFELINMLNKSFLLLVIAANVASWPIAYVLTQRWLAGFAFRIDMPFWPFVVATFSSITIAVLTVSIQARKAAVNNPVDALKYE
ncbi:MAG: ABC transporter permease [Sphingobacteriales bacterium]|nr:MAG: ABC transporter permease [Sphingobacteriales bacterium]